MSFKIRTLVKVYELEPTNIEGDTLCYRLEIFSDGTIFSARLQRYDYFRIQPTFPQREGEPIPELLCDEEFAIYDAELGSTVRGLRETSEVDLLGKVARLFAATFPGSRGEHPAAPDSSASQNGYDRSEPA